MIYYKEYITHQSDIRGKRKKFDNTIYTLDIETTSYLKLEGKILPGIEYQNLSKEKQEESEYCSCMYIWMFSINDNVYYGRTWDELESFIKQIDEVVPERKIIFIHNLSFEFQYLKSHFNMRDVLARKARKVMKCLLSDYNFELRCSYMMSNCALKKLTDLYKLPVQKMVGDLDYKLIRTPITPLSDKELGYCENDCLVVYHYIKYELETYENINKIPLTSTGHVRRELKALVLKDFKYRRLVGKAINTDPHIYNLLQQAFAGGYTHANWIYTDEIINDVDSWDFTSSYPYILVTHKFPSSEFKKCNIEYIHEMSKRLAYILVVKFKKIKCKYFNNFISQSKCRNILHGKYDNGRVMEAEELEMTLTDVDFRFIVESYNCEYEILESYYSQYNYLPKQFINFVLEKYVIKTKYKGIEEKEIEYNKEKSKFNSLYGMSVTNTIRDEVKYKNEDGTWEEIKLTNEEIEQMLLAEKKQCFLSFAYGVWVTAWARYNLLSNVVKLDKDVIYCDTDSIKLKRGYDINVINNYNKSVEDKIKYVSDILDIDYNKFAPEDIKGNKRILGVFDQDEHYIEFITQGAKKYAFKKVDKKTNDYKIGITVAGVPKNGASVLKNLDEFRDNLVFDFNHTNKNLLIYCENMKECEIIDYLGNKYIVNDKTGCCLVPTTYVLSKALEYSNLINDNSSSRSIYIE